MDSIDFVARLKSGRRLYGTSIVSSSPLWPPAVKRAGADFVFIDTEHKPLDRATVAEMCLAYGSLGLPPLVRIPSPDPWEACKVLDGGAAGVLAPYIESPEQVRQLVGATKLRPLKGERLEEALNDRHCLGEELNDYLDRRNAGGFLMINIESVPALQRLDRILAVPGLDGVVIGPHDLSVSLGIPEQYTHPRFDEAVGEIVSQVRQRGLGIGIHFPEDPDLQIKWARQGLNVILHSSDARLFQQALERDLAAIRGAVGDEHG
ncbi:MAG: aldolase/citrate lyase family protein [Planctomycetes bacterium]|jgi:4-hydroxy-2-oxoheptanedioate aldolase|nr:aldolase/citrate lyase family protein [Planctomycetota bacterium]